MAVKISKLSKVIIDKLKTYEYNAQYIKIIAEDLVAGYKTTKTVALTKLNDFEKIQSDPAIFEVYNDHKYRYTSVVIDGDGNESEPSEIVDEVNSTIDPINDITSVISPFSITLTPDYSGNDADETSYYEWFITTDSTVVPDENTEPTHKSKNELVYPGKFTETYNTLYVYCRRVNIYGIYSDWSDASNINGIAKVSAENDVGGLGALATKDTVDLDTEVTNKSLAILDSTANNKLNGIEDGAQVNTINSGDDISLLTNDAGYQTETDVDGRIDTLRPDDYYKNSEITNSDINGLSIGGMENKSTNANARNGLKRVIKTMDIDGDGNAEDVGYTFMGAQGDNSKTRRGGLIVINRDINDFEYIIAIRMSEEDNISNDFLLGYKKRKDNDNTPTDETEILTEGFFDQGITYSGDIKFNDASFINVTASTLMSSNQGSFGDLNSESLVMPTIDVGGDDSDSSRNITITLKDYYNNDLTGNHRYLVNVWVADSEYGDPNSLDSYDFNPDTGFYDINNGTTYSLHLISDSNYQVKCEFNDKDSGTSDISFYVHVEIQGKIFVSSQYYLNLNQQN